MGPMIRTTVIGLLRPGVTFEAIQDFVSAKIRDKALTGFKTVTGVTCTADGETRLHIKFSKLSPAEELDHRWNLAISNEFYEAGYGDVAWKFTEVGSEDPCGEVTTDSVQPDLFSGLAAGEQGRPHRWEPPGPLGSEAFWRWYEERDD